MEGADPVIHRRRPWDQSWATQGNLRVGPTDATVLGLEQQEDAPRNGVSLPGLRREPAKLFELRLPLGHGGVLRNAGVPMRPAIGKEPVTDDERHADRAMRRLEQTLARVHELEIANDDPILIWDRLAQFWHNAEEEAKPLVSEIVLQSQGMPRHLSEILGKLRRVLRRERAMVPLDRVQEMDQSSMMWLTRQPGNTLPERAGPSQRVQAIVRNESYDTGENRVLHSWCRLAGASARDWLRHNAHARAARRFAQVEALRRAARIAARDLQELGIGLAPEDQLPNFVLTQDLDYREVYEGWRRLLNEKRRLDELWAWQGRTWSDFCALAVTLAIRAIDGARLVASSPVMLFPDHDRGAWFGADRPLAVFFLEEQRLVVEIQYRPRHVERLQETLAAPIWLRIGTLSSMDQSRRIPVWPRLVFSPVNLMEEAISCDASIAPLAAKASIHRALIMHSDPVTGVAHSAAHGQRVTSIGIAPSGRELRDGFHHIAQLLEEEVSARVGQG